MREVIAQMWDGEGLAEPVPAHVLRLVVAAQRIHNGDAGVVPLRILWVVRLFGCAVKNLKCLLRSPPGQQLCGHAGGCIAPAQFLSIELAQEALHIAAGHGDLPQHFGAISDARWRR